MVKYDTKLRRWEQDEPVTETTKTCSGDGTIIAADHTHGCYSPVVPVSEIYGIDLNGDGYTDQLHVEKENGSITYHALPPKVSGMHYTIQPSSTLEITLEMSDGSWQQLYVGLDPLLDDYMARKGFQV